jgi:glycerol-3-phosphate O-acyltransferase
MIQRLIYDPKVAEAISEHAKATGVPENVAFEAARRYAREIVPSFSATAYFGVVTRLARWISRSVYRVRLGYFDEEAIANIAPQATVVFVMNHRSNMDYVLVTHLAAERSALSYAVGEWARVWPLQGFLRSSGAYFIRRNSKSMLYRRVLGRYVQLATEGGVAQAVFPEGGLSLTGHLRAPKLGILNYVISGFHPESERDVVFIPVALNYDRILEDRVLRDAAAKGGRNFRFSIFGMLGFVLRQLRFLLTGRFHRFGYAAVSFGEPLSLREFGGNEEPDADLTERVGAELMGRVEQIMPALPVPIVARVLLEAKQPLSREELGERVANSILELQAAGAHVHIPRGNAEYATNVGLRMLLLRKFVSDQGNSIEINGAGREFLEFYASSIAHLCADPLE